MSIYRLLGIGFAVVLVFFLGLFLDGVDGILSLNAKEMPILMQLRLPRTIAALASGGLLACAGATVQYQFRNVLAEPGLIGISGGAALSAAVALQLGAIPLIVSIASFSGAAMALLIVWCLAGAAYTSTRLILAGIAINALTGSFLMLLMTVLPSGALHSVTFWLMGSFSASNWHTALSLIIALPIIWFLLWHHWRYLNLLQLGENVVFYTGYSLIRWRFSAVALATLSTALVVSQCGMVGFIGLMAPHLCRVTIGGDARQILFFSPLIGALLTGCADVIARLAIYPIELPVGVITSLTGVPFFLWLMVRMQRRSANALAE